MIGSYIPQGNTTRQISVLKIYLTTSKRFLWTSLADCKIFQIQHQYKRVKQLIQVPRHILHLVSFKFLENLLLQTTISLGHWKQVWKVKN